MASILDDIDVTMDNGDVTLIKEKLFKRLNGQGIATCELIEVYTLMQLDIPFEDIDYLIAEGKCIEIPRAIKTTTPLCWNDPSAGSDTCLPPVSDLNLCKEYMFDKELFYAKYDTNISYYDHDQAARDSLDHRVMCCYLSFSPELEMEFMDYRKHNKNNKKDKLFTWSDLLGQQGTTPLKADAPGLSNIVWDSSTPLSSSAYANTLGSSIQAISTDVASSTGGLTVKADMLANAGN